MRSCLRGNPQSFLSDLDDLSFLYFIQKLNLILLKKFQHAFIVYIRIAKLNGNIVGAFPRGNASQPQFLEVPEFPRENALNFEEKTILKNPRNQIQYMSVLQNKKY